MLRPRHKRFEIPFLFPNLTELPIIFPISYTSNQP